MNYLPLLSVEFIHNYFSSGKCKPFRFELSRDCEKQMRYFSQVFRFNETQFTTLKDFEKVRALPDGTVNEDYFFDIAVYPVDSQFSVYSGVEASFRHRISYYLSPSEKAKVNSKDSQLFTLQLQGAEEEVLYEAVQVILKPAKFDIVIDAVPGDSFKLLDKKNNTVNQWTIQETGQGKFSAYIDASKASNGFLELEKNGATVARYYADDGFFKSRPPFILGFDFSLASLKKGESYLVLNYKIRFASRPVFWIYHVIVKGNNRKLESLSIVNNNEKMLPGVTFPRSRIDEKEAQVEFISDRPLPLTDKGYIDIELVDSESIGRPLVVNLPNPSLSSIRCKESKWISDIFVYI